MMMMMMMMIVDDGIMMTNMMIIIAHDEISCHSSNAKENQYGCMLLADSQNHQWITAQTNNNIPFNQQSNLKQSRLTEQSMTIEVHRHFLASGCVLGV